MRPRPLTFSDVQCPQLPAHAEMSRSSSRRNKYDIIKPHDYSEGDWEIIPVTDKNRIII